MKKQNYHEKELGKVPADVRDLKLSKNAQEILNGEHDDEPPNPQTQPLLYKFFIKAKLKDKKAL